jgi:arylsulfatase A-like enzyme
VYQYCSPSRSSLQSGRNPIHVNVLNADMAVHNPNDTVSGCVGGIGCAVTGSHTPRR